MTDNPVTAQGQSQAASLKANQGGSTTFSLEVWCWRAVTHHAEKTFAGLESEISLKDHLSFLSSGAQVVLNI